MNTQDVDDSDSSDSDNEPPPPPPGASLATTLPGAMEVEGT